MELSILIPTHGRPERLDACLRSLAHQDNAPDFEVLVGVDGGNASAQDLRRDIPDPIRARTLVIDFDKVGYIPIRRALLKRASAPIVLSLNDDVVTAPQLLATHMRQHRDRPGQVVTGPAPFAPVDRPNLFDRLVAESPLVFFDPTSGRSTPGTPFETDYRNCFGLNMSFERDRAIDLGGFHDLPDTYGYDDIELAWRFQTQDDARITFDPRARVTHHHRLTPREVLRREYQLGRAATEYAQVNPAFTRTMFGPDFGSPEYRERARIAMAISAQDAARAERHFIRLETLGHDAASETLLEPLAAGWVILKRFLWRWGVLDSAAGLPERWSLLPDAHGLHAWLEHDLTTVL